VFSSDLHLLTSTMRRSIRSLPSSTPPPASTRNSGFQTKVDLKTGSVTNAHIGRTKLDKAIERVVSANLEIKYRDTALAYTNINASGNLASLCEIPQGITETTRVGDSITLRKVEIRVSGYQNNTTSVQFPNLVRVIIFRYATNTALGGAPVSTSVLTYASTLDIGASITSLYNTQSAQDGSVQILHDSYHQTSLNSNSFAYQWEMNLDSEITYNPALLTGAGKLHVLVLADDVGLVSPCATVAYSARVYFTD